MAKDEKAAETKGKKKKKPMLLIIILAAAVVLLGGGGFFAWKMMSGKSAPAAQGGQGTESGAKESHAQGKSGGHGGEGQAADVGGATITLEPFLVNLADKDANRYLKTTIRILVTTQVVAKEINESDVMMPRIRDHILSILANKMAVEITTNEGKQQLKKEIVEKVNEFLPEKCAKEVFFTDFVVQL